MFRFFVIVGLFLSLVFLGRGMLAALNPLELPPPVSPPVKKPVPKKGIRLADFYPKPPVVMPELSDGYLFNEERLLVTAEPEAPEEPAAEPEEPALAVDMETLEYVGSIIVGELRKGMVAFTVLEPQAKQAPKRRLPAPGRRLPGRQTTAKKVSKKPSSKKYATVKEKDDFYGYTVVLVAPDRIVFSKGDSKVEKLLYDPEKERLAPPPITRQAARPAARPAPAGRSAARPAARPATPVRPPTRQTPAAARPSARLPASPHSRATTPPPATRPRPTVIQRRRVPTGQGR